MGEMAVFSSHSFGLQNLPNTLKEYVQAECYNMINSVELCKHKKDVAETHVL